MNKVLALFAATCLAGVSYGGSVLWTSDAFKGDTQLDGAIAYLFVGDDISGVSDAIKGGTLDYSSALASATSVIDEGYGTIIKSGIGSYKDTTVSLYMVLFDTATVTDSSNFVVAGPISQTFKSTGNKTFDFSSSVASATWAPVKDSPTPGPIPEPTTAALLALGLAAAGLKRKVA